jgi:hypothetical protein
MARSALAAGEALAFAAGEGLGEGLPNRVLPTAETVCEVPNATAATQPRIVILSVYFILFGLWVM